eukprot:CAMPEP_0180779652 /NCGR_PEP_ID=MMETSP1038_2-20121128/46533_1 /TAXON_ID=632150 /ORGANISM="Azadinium spinosum, Strain 3D9" /LENGTH=109 /DNA_ID=CAMNT_0022815025 /DNA_START=601 /DNA_END=930 /DNA_ORIENTATION=+
MLPAKANASLSFQGAVIAEAKLSHHAPLHKFMNAFQRRGQLAFCVRLMKVQHIDFLDAQCLQRSTHLDPYTLRGEAFADSRVHLGVDLHRTALRSFSYATSEHLLACTV